MIGERNGPEAGFTVIELLTVLILIVILAGMAVPEFGRMKQEREVANARNTLVLLAGRARLEALKQGEPVLFEVLPDSGLARVKTLSGNVIDQVIYSDGDFEATVTTSNGLPVRLCYSSRGFALRACTMNGLPVKVRFARGVYRDSARVHPLGQVEAL